MSESLPQVLRENMDKWGYDNNGKIIAVKGASFDVIKAIKKINQSEEQTHNNGGDIILN